MVAARHEGNTPRTLTAGRAQCLPVQFPACVQGCVCIGRATQLRRERVDAEHVDGPEADGEAAAERGARFAQDLVKLEAVHGVTAAAVK